MRAAQSPKQSQSLFLKHCSDEKKECLKEIAYTIDLGEDPIFEVNDSEAIIDHIVRVENGYDIFFKPIPNTHNLSGNITIYNSKTPCVFETFEFFITQENTIYIEEDDSILEGSCNPCNDGCAKCVEEDENKVDNYGLIPFIHGSWIKRLSVHCFNDNGLRFVIEDKVIKVVCKPLESVYDEPVYINGYDENGSLLSSSVFYFSYIYPEHEEEDKNELLVVPSEIIIPNEDYDSLEDVVFTCNSFGFDDNITCSIKDTSFKVPTPIPSGNGYKFDFLQELRKKYANAQEITSDNCKVEITFQADDCIPVTRLIKLLKYEEPVAHGISILIYYWNDGEKVELKDKNNVPLTTITFGEQNDKAKTIKTDFSVEVTSNSAWFILDYPNDIFACAKTSDNTFEISLIDYSAQPNDLAIVLGNVDGNTCTIIAKVPKDLHGQDKYSMYWRDTESDELTVSYYTNKDQEYHVGDMHSAYSLIIEGNEIKYGEWRVASSRTVNYIVKQCRINETSKNKEWVEIRSNRIGTKSINTADEITSIDDETFDIRVFVNAEPKDPQENDVWVYTNDTFNVKTTGYIDFYQNTDEAKVRLSIVHEPVVKFRVYTDQTGEIIVDRNPK